MATIQWRAVKKHSNVIYKKCKGVALIAFKYPDEDISIGVALLSPSGSSSTKNNVYAFCSDEHQKYVRKDGCHRLTILEEVQKRFVQF